MKATLVLQRRKVLPGGLAIEMVIWQLLAVYALAKRLGRNYSNVHTDVKRLVALGLIERDQAKRVWVPWTEIQIRLPLAKAA